MLNRTLDSAPMAHLDFSPQVSERNVESSCRWVYELMRKSYTAPRVHSWMFLGTKVIFGDNVSFGTTIHVALLGA